MYTRLNKLGLCISNKTAVRLVKKLGHHHDNQVYKWKRDLGRGVNAEVADYGTVASDSESLATDGESVNNEDLNHNAIDYNSFVTSDDHSVATNRYIITGDNLDKTIKPRFMTINHQTQSLHYFHAYAALNRISFSGLSEDTPTSRLLRSLSASIFLPSLNDCQKLRNNYVVLVARVICSTLKTFGSFQSYIPKHILHKYSTAMSTKSVTVCFITPLILLTTLE